MPPVHLPLIAVAGLVLWFLGWLSLPLEHPLYTGLSWPVIALNGLLALGAGTLAAQLYSGFTAGRADVLMAVRGGAAGLVAISAAAPFVAPWGAFVIGLLAGAVVPVLHYIIEHVWRREDLTASISVFLAAGLWGLIALGLLANGQHGVGWNALGREEFLGTPPQGVSGLIVAPGLVSDTRQIIAQLVGAVTIFLAGFVPAALVFLCMRLPGWLADARRRQLAALAAARAAAAEAAAAPEGLDALLAGIEPREETPPEAEATPVPFEEAAGLVPPEPEPEPEPGPSATGQPEP
jgi:Amt family ammonium transporter